MTIFLVMNQAAQIVFHKTSFVRRMMMIEIGVGLLFATINAASVKSPFENLNSIYTKSKAVKEYEYVKIMVRVRIKRRFLLMSRQK